MSALSRNKGASGERELARLLGSALDVRLERNQTRDHGLAVAPGQDHATARELDSFALECKRYASITPGLVATWWKQTQRQAEAVHKLPALAYRADRCPWSFALPWSALHDALPPDKTATLSLPAFTALVERRAHDHHTGGTA